MRNKLIFRAEGNAEIGLGHLYRLLGLHSILKDSEAYFVTSSKSLTSFFPENIHHIEISKDVNSELDWLADTFDPKDCILITDGYDFDYAYQQRIKELGFNLIAVDDFIKNDYAADVILNPAPIQSSNKFKSKECYGIPYALLRKEFIHEAQKGRSLKEIRKAFVSFGGSDYNKLALKTTRMLLEMNLFDEIHVLSGVSALEDLQNAFQDHSNVEIHHNLNVNQLIELMKKCQLAVVPCSTISYEVSCLGLFVLAGYYVDNQELIHEGLWRQQLIFDAGNYNEMTSEKMNSLVRSIINLSDHEKSQYLENQAKHFNGKQIENLNHLVDSLR